MWVGEPFCLILNDSLLRVEFLKIVSCFIIVIIANFIKVFLKIFFCV